MKKPVKNIVTVQPGPKLPLNKAITNSAGMNSYQTGRMAGLVLRLKPKTPRERLQNIFKDIGFDDAEAANLDARSRLMILLEKEIQRLKISQTQAAKILGVKPPRVSELLNGRIEKFSLDLLVVYLARLGKAVDFKLKLAA